MVQANQRPGAPLRDERLEISSSGKSRSDPARMRARAGQRGRGRQSLDLARDLKRSLANPTIDENVRGLPILGFRKSFEFVNALHYHISSLLWIAHRENCQRCTPSHD